MPNSPVDRVELSGLDPMLEHRVRLAICVLLSRNDVLSFSRLKDLLEETDGNLGAHLRRLEEGDYIAVRKEFVDRKPVSWYSLRAPGRKALRSHLDALSQLIERGREGEKARGRETKG